MLLFQHWKQKDGFVMLISFDDIPLLLVEDKKLEVVSQIERKSFNCFATNIAKVRDNEEQLPNPKFNRPPIWELPITSSMVVNSL